MTRFLIYAALAVANLAYGLWGDYGNPVFGPGFHFWTSGALAVFALRYYLDWRFGRR